MSKKRVTSPEPRSFQEAYDTAWEAARELGVTEWRIELNAWSPVQRDKDTWEWAITFYFASPAGNCSHVGGHHESFCAAMEMVRAEFLAHTGVRQDVGVQRTTRKKKVTP